MTNVYMNGSSEPNETDLFLNGTPTSGNTDSQKQGLDWWVGKTDYDIVRIRLRKKGYINSSIASRYNVGLSSLQNSIHKLRRKGWDIATIRTVHVDGRPIPTYRLVKEPDLELTEEDTLIETIEVSEAKQGDSSTYTGEEVRSGTQQDRIKRVLLSGESIDQFKALKYGVENLSPLISKIRRMNHLSIKKMRVPDGRGGSYLSYSLDTDIHRSDEAEGSMQAEGDRQNFEEVTPQSIPERKIRFIVPISASEISVTLTRADFDFMMQIVNAGA